MTISEHIENLVNNKSYLEARIKAGNELVNFIRDQFPRDWKRISKREKDYQNLLNLIVKGGL
jgi:hypothetical protein